MLHDRNATGSLGESEADFRNSGTLTKDSTDRRWVVVRVWGRGGVLVVVEVVVVVVMLTLVRRHHAVKVTQQL